MARSGGFEPPTAWFVARYSIQLSYERTKTILQMAVRKGFESSHRQRNIMKFRGLRKHGYTKSAQIGD